jgi:hypothetical protein
MCTITASSTRSSVCVSLAWVNDDGGDMLLLCGCKIWLSVWASFFTSDDGGVNRPELTINELCIEVGC